VQTFQYFQIQTDQVAKEMLSNTLVGSSSGKKVQFHNGYLGRYLLTIRIHYLLSIPPLQAVIQKEVSRHMPDTFTGQDQEGNLPNLGSWSVRC
jgi:hypothetical protein